MASRALRGQPQPNRRGRLNAILGIVRFQFGGDRTPFVAGDVAAMEPGGNLLIERAVRQQVASQLLDRESVERLIAIKGVDDPLTVRPNLAVVVEMQAMRVGVASGIEPVAGAMLAVLRLGHPSVHELVVGIGGLVHHKRLHLGWIGRQAGEIERQTTSQCAAVSFRGGGQAVGFQLQQHKSVDRAARPIGPFYRRFLGSFGRDKSPMLLPFRPLLNPEFHQLFLLCRQLLLGLFRRHQVVFILRNHARVHLAVHRLAGDDRDPVLGFTENPGFAIQPQVGLAAGRVGTMTLKTIFREDWPNIAVELYISSS